MKALRKQVVGGGVASVGQWLPPMFLLFFILLPVQNVFALSQTTSTTGVNITAEVPSPPASPKPAPGPTPGPEGTPGSSTPDTTITKQPAALTNDTSATFEFTSTITPATILCELDLLGEAACTPPRTYTGLSEGRHGFRVRAVSETGAADATPAEYGWVIDTTAPQISNVDPFLTSTSAKIVWNTDEPANSLVQLGKTTAYGQSGTDNNYVTEHAITITDLSPATTYHYKVFSTDEAGNTASTNDLVLTTPPDTGPPGNVQNLAAQVSENTITLTWTNPTDPDLKQIVIVRKTSGFPAGPKDGTIVFSGLDEAFADGRLDYNTTYYYGVFAEDTSGNYSSGALIRAQTAAEPGAPPPPPKEEPPGEEGQPPAPPPGEPPGEEGGAPRPRAGEGEAGGDGSDAGGEGADGTPGSDGAGEAGAGTGFGPGGAGAPGEEGFGIGPEGGALGGGEAAVLVPPTTVSPDEKLALGNFQFFTAKGAIHLGVVDSAVAVLGGQDLYVSLAAGKIVKPVALFAVNVGSSSFLFTKRDNLGVYDTDITFGLGAGEFPATIILNYEDGTSDTMAFKVVVSGRGHIFVVRDGEKVGVSGASVTLLQNSAPWGAGAYAQINPVPTSATGYYGFAVPNGTYALQIIASGFLTRTTAPFAVSNNMVNRDIELIALPPLLAEVIKKDAPFAENAAAVASVVSQWAVVGAKVTIQNAQEFADNPQVEATTENVVVPVSVVVAVANVSTAVRTVSLLNYLQYIFTQPLFVLLRRKRRGWGVVYHALTKMPIDLAMVRLLDMRTGRIIQSRVTDKEGRYAFIAKPGQYKLEVTKQGFVFPSAFLKEQKEDKKFADLYHGELVEVTEAGALITANIPLDPVEVHVTAAKLRFKKFITKAQDAVGFAGILITAVSFAIVPQISIGIMLVVHIGLYFLFRRLAHPAKPKSWGIVYDAHTRTPLKSAIARIFDVQYNKLLETQVTDSRGRYAFLVGNNKYYVVYERPGYERKQSEVVDYEGKGGATLVAMDVALRRGAVAPVVAITAPMRGLLPNTHIDQKVMRSSLSSPSEGVDLITFSSIGLVADVWNRVFQESRHTPPLRPFTGRLAEAGS